jgi:hypothetical protein
MTPVVIVSRHGETLRKPRDEIEMGLVVVGLRGGVCVEEAFEMLLGSERDALFEGSLAPWLGDPGRLRESILIDVRER